MERRTGVHPLDGIPKARESVTNCNSIISVTDVGKIYSTRAGSSVAALRDVTVDVEKDQFVTLVGPSGCGKSTLLKLIAGVMAPTVGEIKLNGQRLERPSRRVGMVFQRPVLLPWRSVLDNILFPIEMLGWPVSKYRDTAVHLINLVGLRGFESALPSELSGGMQQRVSICRALVYDPEVLLMDEPFGALDAMTREDLGVELLRIWTERRKTVLFVTHSISEAVLLADRVIVMAPRPGRVILDLPISLSRPRGLASELSSDFNGYVRTVRDAISGEAR
jgi:NitT/TauT family transport system ATP-binding protein